MRQFLDIGTGIPTANNTHEVAQAVAPDSRVVYVDRDPVVLIHARALLTSSPEGSTDYIEADARDAGAILAHAAGVLDFSRPVALMLVAILHFIPDEDRPYDIVAKLVDALPSGSMVTITHPCSDVDTAETAGAAREFNDRATQRVTLRSQDQVARFFDGLDLADPGHLALLRRPAFTAALIAIFAGMFTAYGFMAYTSIWLQSLTGLSPLQAGLVILPSAVASMAVSVMAGHWLRRFLPRYSLPVALLLVAAGALAQTGLTPASTGSRVIAGLLISGLGMGMVFPAASSLAVESVPHRRAGMAAGAFTTFQQLGYAIGVAIFATVVAAMAKTGLTGHVTDPRATAQQLTGGGAHAITTRAPAAARSALEHLLRAAFVHGLNAVALIGAILALAAAVITALALRRETTATQSHAEPDTADTVTPVNS